MAGAVAGSAVAGKRAERKNTASKENRGNTTSSMGTACRLSAVLDTKNKEVKDKANAVKENIKDMPTQTAYAVYSAKEKAKSSVSDFKRVFRWKSIELLLFDCVSFRISLNYPDRRPVIPHTFL